MVVKTGWNRFLQTVFIIFVIIGVLVVARATVVMSVSPFVVKEAQKGNYAPASLYYGYLWISGDFMEPYKAYYNLGTSFAQYEDYESAEGALEIALAKVDYIYGECYIRNNLSIVQEKRGDYYKLSEMEDLADSYYQKAIETIQNAPSACFPPPPPNGGGENGEGEGNGGTPGDPNSPPEPTDMSDTGEQMKETESSSQGKSDEIQGGKDGSGKEQVQNEQNQLSEEQQNQQDQQSQKQESEGKPKVDKPW